MENILALFLIVVAASLGGTIAKLLKLPTLVGYIIAGIFFGAILPGSVGEILGLAQVGTILLLFSIGLELSLDSLSKFFKVAFFGAIIQIVLATLVFFPLVHFLGLSQVASIVLALGFSLSSTALVVKILTDAGELETIHGGLMLGWLLVQDLAVVPIMVVLPALAAGSGVVFGPILISLLKSIGVVAVAVFLGKIVVPFLIHKIAAVNLREVLLLSSVALALGTAVFASLIDISPALGAFLAGFVISGSYEHHAIFAEMRPLRDLFVALFFVSLGFLVSPGIIFSKFPTLIAIAVSVIVVKSLIVFSLSTLFGYRGRTAVTAGLGLSQVGEFAFIIFSQALLLKILSPEDTSLGIAVTLLTLLTSPLLFRSALPLWRGLRGFFAKNRELSKLFSSGEGRETAGEAWHEHIIICGYGRVGKWVGRALGEYKIPFVVVEYNQAIVSDLKTGGINVLYGDPVEPEVMEAAGVRSAKAVILAIPDNVAQETLIAYIETVAPHAKIISRVHKDEDWEKLKTLRVDKIVQPEFEGAVAIVRSILTGMGKPKEEVLAAIKSLRLSHSK